MWPVVLANRRQYCRSHFEKFMGVVELDVSDVLGSLKRAVQRLEKAMRDEERQEVYQDLFWAKKLFGEYLPIEEEAYSDGAEQGPRALNQGGEHGEAETNVKDLVWTERVFEDI